MGTFALLLHVVRILPLSPAQRGGRRIIGRGGDGRMDKIFNGGGGERSTGGERGSWTNPPLSSKVEEVEGGKKNGLIFVVVKKKEIEAHIYSLGFSPSPSLPPSQNLIPATFS